MSAPEDDPTTQARDQVERARIDGDPAGLAAALEQLATVVLETADFEAAGGALEEAASHWARTGRVESQGNCLLLASSSYRLAGNAGAAARAVASGLALGLPPRLHRALALERCEQQLAAGDTGAAACFAEFLAAHAAGLEAPLVAHVHQRRAAALVTARRFAEAADDLLAAAAIFRSARAPAEEEACAVAAAAVLAEENAAAAEAVLASATTSVPQDGRAAARRGLVGGTIAMKAGAPEVALARFDAARQGALDATDPAAYLSAAVGASKAAEALGRANVAYARLATAWGTLSDLVGRDAADRLVKPSLLALKERLGDDVFDKAGTEYEEERRERLRREGQ